MNGNQMFAAAVATAERIRDEALARHGYGHGPVSSTFDLVAHLYRQRDFSFNTFGPPGRGGVAPHVGVLDHIRKELTEIEAKPHDLEEWIDVVILALDGALRHGHNPRAIASALWAKQAKNERRTWPDWRTATPGKAIEHVRSAEPTETDILEG